MSEPLAKDSSTCTTAMTRPTPSPRTTDPRLAEIRAREQAATPGPWGVEENEHCWMLFGGSSGWGFIEPQLIKAPKQSREYAEYWPNAADSDFIVNSRSDIGYLLGLVDELQGAKERLTEQRGVILRLLQELAS